MEVYLLNGLDGAQISFTTTNQGEHQWYRFTESIDDAIPILSTKTGNTSVITDVNDGYGYYVASPMGTGYIWIIDYSRYIPTISGLRAMTEDEYQCERLKLAVNADIKPVYYYTGGRRNNLLREFILTYNTSEWNGAKKMFLPVEVKLELNENEISPEIVISTPPLTNTTFTLYDSFSAHFGVVQTVPSDEYRAVAVEVHGFAETTKIHADNELHSEGNTLGGSAPIEYTFTAYANEDVAASYYWIILQQDSITGNMTTIVQRNEKSIQHNFDRDGYYLVKLDAGGGGQFVCVDTTQTYEVIIDNTIVKIPNAFSPGSSIGINDELKISFSSVIPPFKASVYNRWGNLLFQWSDPAKGWDGRVNGKFVPAGAYLVIVEYKDSSGKTRSMSKMVNILRKKE